MNVGRPKKQPGDKYTRLSITLPPDVAVALRQAAAEKGLKLSGYIQQMLSIYTLVQDERVAWK